MYLPYAIILFYAVLSIKLLHWERCVYVLPRNMRNIYTTEYTIHNIIVMTRSVFYLYVITYCKTYYKLWKGVYVTTLYYYGYIGVHAFTGCVTIHLITICKLSHKVYGCYNMRFKQTYPTRGVCVHTYHTRVRYNKFGTYTFPKYSKTSRTYTHSQTSARIQNSSTFVV